MILLRLFAVVLALFTGLVIALGSLGLAFRMRHFALRPGPRERDDQGKVIEGEYQVLDDEASRRP